MTYNKDILTINPETGEQWQATANNGNMCNIMLDEEGNMLFQDDPNAPWMPCDSMTLSDEGFEEGTWDGYWIVDTTNGTILGTTKSVFGHDCHHKNILLEKGELTEENGIFVQENVVLRFEPTGWMVNTITNGYRECTCETMVGDAEMRALGYDVLSDVPLC